MHPTADTRVVIEFLGAARRVMPALGATRLRNDQALGSGACPRVSGVGYGVYASVSQSVLTPVYSDRMAEGVVCTY
jgi:hypothetical protein